VSDYETRQKIQNIAVGIFVILGICAFTWLVFMFGDLPTLVGRINSFKVYVQFPSASGVQQDTPVRFCGYQVGRVTEIRPPEILDELQFGRKTGRRYFQSLVLLSIDKNYDKIPSNVDVKLMTRGLASSYIELVVEPNLPLMALEPDRPETEYLTDGALLQGSTGISSEFFPEQSQKKLDELAENMLKLTENINLIAGDPNNRENIKKSLDNFAKTTEQATKTLKELESFFRTANTTSEELTKSIAQLRMVIEKVNENKGSVGRLINDASLYESLLENSEQLKSLLKEAEEVVKKLKKEGVKVKL